MVRKQKYSQGDIVFIDLDPAKGTEQKKKRPCLIISNDNYNKVFNTIIVIPISSSQKYLEDEKYRVSPLFVEITCNDIHGAALLQHVRAIDPNLRISNKIKGHISDDKLYQIINVIKQFF